VWGSVEARDILRGLGGPFSLKKVMDLGSLVRSFSCVLFLRWMVLANSVA